MDLLFEISRVIHYGLEPIVMLIVSLLISGYLYFENRKRDAVVFPSMMIIAGVLIKFLKEIIHKARPPIQLIQEAGFSMPSGHATISVVFFGFLAYMISRNKSSKIKWLSAIVVAAIVVLISYSRVYLGVHYFIDVLVGMILGGIILTLGIITSKKLS